VSEEAIHERLRTVRIARGDSLASFAARHGIRVELLRAIEEGRFQDLPTGIYARAAIRSHATALGLDPEEILGICAPFLPVVEDPITAIGRLRGGPVPRWRPATSRTGTESESTVPSDRRSDGALMPLPSWRLIAASAIDATAMAAMLLAVVTGTVAMGVPVSALGGQAAPAFLILALVLSGCYFFVLGGIVGATAGEYLTGVARRVAEPKLLDLRTLAGRTAESALRDVYFIERLGKWIGSLLTHRESVNPTSRFNDSGFVISE
jgi:transcriptional regulator with XRE-family HTH domain